MSFRIFAASLAMLGMAQSTSAADTFGAVKPYSLPTINQAAVIDGVLNEPHWQQALVVDLAYETSPDENTPARQATKAYLYEDGENLYVGFRAEDTEIELLRAYMRDRDAAFDDDFVGIQLDTFNSEQRAYEFFVNPYGAQMDLLFDESTGNEDDSWNAIWESAGVIDDEGYTVEMAIPFSNLRFADTNESKVWGFEVLRVHPRDQRRIYRNVIDDRNRNCTLCRLSKFSGLKDAKLGNQFELNPVLTVASSESRGDDGRMSSNGTNYEPGVNLKWGITPEFTLDATLNPDFSQVEADNAQLAVNETFALFFPEARPFFLEGANYFNTDERVIYTRNVTDPDVGLKVTGRSGGHTIGTFAAQDAVTNIIIPGTFGSDFASLNEESDVFASRYRYDFSPDFNVGAIATYRSAGDYANLVGGVDGFYRWRSKHRLRAQFLTTDTKNSQELQNDFGLAPNQSGNSYKLRYNYNSRNWFQYTNYSRYDEDFRADLGFITQVNKEQWVVGGGRVFYSEDSWWTQIEIGGDWDITHDSDGRLLERELEGRIEVNGPMQSYGNVGYVIRDRLFDDVLFDEKFVTSYFNIQPLRGLLLEAGFNFGDRIDFSNTRLGENFRFTPGIHYSINKHTQLFVHHTYDRLKVSGLRNRTANLTDLRLIYQFTARSFLRLTAQYQNIENESRLDSNFGEVERSRDFNKQLLYSYKVNPRTVFFLGYSDLADSNEDRPSIQVQERGLFMKIGYVFDY
ncbi:MAG: DUF5916 domain-containing protein [Gammaproteobacteria bacterium]